MALTSTLPVCLFVFFSLSASIAFATTFFFWSASFFFRLFDALVTFLQQAENRRGNLKDRHQAWLEEGHKNHFSWERQSRTWNHSSWSNFRGGWEAPFCFQEGWKWSGDQPEDLVIGSSHRENHRIDNLGWKISPSPSNRYCQTRSGVASLKWRNAHLKRAHQERKP